MKTLKNKNVILMFIDDLGYGDLSCFNENSGISTPAIDALAENGMAFTDCHSTSALCTPSRYGLLTGRYNWRSRLKQGVLPGGAAPLIESGRRTLANVFRDAGYFTAAVGKWHLGLGWARKEGCPDAGFMRDGADIDFTKPLSVSPNDYGFDYFFGTAASLDQPPYVYIENRQALGVPDHVTGVFPLDRSHATQQQMWQKGPAVRDYDFRKVMPDMQAKVLELIDAHRQDPFFIYYPCHAVHGPLLPPLEYEGRSGLNLYADTVLYLNDLVAELTQKLKDDGLFENTVFIFASDNGCSGIADYPVLLSKGHNPSYIFRGKKGDIYEGGHRVPMIISAPGEAFAGEKCDALVCLSDLFATCMELLQEKKPEDAGEDSFSFAGMLEDGQAEIRKNVVHSSANGSFSIRNKQWKLELCRNNGAGKMGASSDQDGTSEEIPCQLYAVGADVRECFNVAPDFPDVCLEMLTELIRLIENGRSTPGMPQQNAAVPDWLQLKALYSMKAGLEKNTAGL